MRKFTDAERGEIRSLYREAKNKLAQIGILTELYACDRQDIERELGRPESPKETGNKTTSARGSPYTRWTPEMDEILCGMAADGCTTTAIADRLGVNASAVASRRYALRKSGALPARKKNAAVKPAPAPAPAPPPGEELRESALEEVIFLALREILTLPPAAGLGLELRYVWRRCVRELDKIAPTLRDAVLQYPAAAPDLARAAARIVLGNLADEAARHDVSV